METEKKKSGKGVIVVVLIILALLLLGGCIFVGILLFGGEKSYRFVKVEDYEGDVTIKNDGKKKKIEEGLMLIPGDELTTDSDSFVELLVDSDKHIIAEEDTCFEINATGDEDEGKVLIKLKEGNILCKIDKKLKSKSKFEVKTSNASFSVRGTTFTVTYDPDEKVTTLSVEEGIVYTETKAGDIEVEAGEEVIITDEYYEIDGDRVYAEVDEDEEDYDDLAYNDEEGQNGSDANTSNGSDANTSNNGVERIEGREETLQALDAVRSAVITVMSDPDIIFEADYVQPVNGDTDIEQLFASDIANRALCEILGIGDVSQIKTAFGSDVHVILENGNMVTVYVRESNGNILSVGPHQF